MIAISYNIACNACLKSDGVPHIYYIKDVPETYFENKTEYEVMDQILEWRLRDNHKCEFCGSPSVEVSEIKADGSLLYNFDLLVSECEIYKEDMYIFAIEKENNNIKTKNGGSKFPKSNFLLNLFSYVKVVITNRDENLFIPHIKGFFFICLTISYSKKFDKPEFKIQQLTSQGFSKSQILEVISNQIEIENLF